MFTAILLLIIPLAFSLSIKDLISRYSFSTSTSQINVTNIKDFMIDVNSNGANDTLVLELTAKNANGNFIFVVNLFDKSGILTNETNKSLSSGANKLNITFSSVYFSQDQFNYSIKVYNSSFSLKFRKDNIPTQNYSNYEQGFKILDIRDSKLNKTLQINVTLNSSINGEFEGMAFLTYNNSAVAIKKNYSITNSTQELFFYFGNETIKRTHYTGKFNISSIKIGKKAIRANFTTGFYDFKDFAETSFISGLSDGAYDANGNDKYDFLQINASVQVLKNGNYALTVALYDLFDSIVEIKNSSSEFNSGINTISIKFKGSRINDKKLNGPFIVKYAQLFENGALIDQLNDAFVTGNYNFNDFDKPNLPDIKVIIKVSDGYHYGIDNITINFTFKNVGSKHAFSIFTDIFDNKTFARSNKTNLLGINSEIAFQINFTNFSDAEIRAIADSGDFVEESNESNNAEKLVIKLNRRPSLDSVSNFTVNETGKITINLSADDHNGDNLSFSINLSKFSNKINIFEWNTTTTDSGNYTLSATASDGYLNDSKIFKVIVLDVPEKDIDNDGIDDNIDKLIGDEKFVNTSTINLSISLNNSMNLSKFLNQSMTVKFFDGNKTAVEFEFDFFKYKLNLTNLTINKQKGNETGLFIVSGLSLPENATKTIYLDRVYITFNGVCIKDEDILSIKEISGSCNSANEFKVECDGTLQNFYICAFNSTLNKYKVQGLKHSGVIQLDYVKPAQSSGSSSSAAGASSSSTSGGGGSLFCENCTKNEENKSAENEFRNEKIDDEKFEETQDRIFKDADKNKRVNELGAITGQSIKTLRNIINLDTILGFALIVLISFFTIKTRIFSKIFK